MAVTPAGNPYVESSDLVANYPGASEALAERIDIVGVNPFADSAARATAIPSPTEGMMSSLNDTDSVQRYDGATWQPVGGKVVQMVSVQTSAVATGTTVIPFDDTIPQITEGAQYMSLAITPTDASNILVIEVFACLSCDGLRQVTTALYVGTTPDALAVSPETIGSGYILITPLIHSVVAGGTSELTFRVRVGPQSAATVTFNGIAGARMFGTTPKSSMRITEYTP